jgi:hypothetical protein
MAQMVVTAGIDVSKGWLNIALWPEKAELQIDRAAAGYDQLAAWSILSPACKRRRSHTLISATRY